MLYSLDLSYSEEAPLENAPAWFQRKVARLRSSDEGVVPIMAGSVATLRGGPSVAWTIEPLLWRDYGSSFCF